VGEAREDDAAIVGFRPENKVWSVVAVSVGSIDRRLKSVDTPSPSHLWNHHVSRKFLAKSGCQRS
jgi:hypothetical protein